MHSEHARLVAEDIRASTSYDQMVYLHECGTPGCIAAFAASLSMPHQQVNKFSDCEIRDFARTYLDLTDLEAEDLFCACPRESNWGTFGTRFEESHSANGEKQIAAEYLEHLADLAEAQ